jgi:hypothetical protein
LETNSFFARIAKNKLVFIFLIIVLVSSIISNYLLGYYIISEFTPDYTIKAIELDEKPTKRTWLQCWRGFTAVENGVYSV